MQWVLDNWLWIVFGGGMVAMHLFGHGGHGKTGEPPPSKTGNSGDPS